MTDSGLVIDKPFKLAVAPIMGDRLVPGRYRLQLQFAPGGVVEVETASSKQTIDTAATPAPAFDIEVTTSPPDLNLRPVRGSAALTDAVLVPVRRAPPIQAGRRSGRIRPRDAPRP